MSSLCECMGASHRVAGSVNLQGTQSCATQESFHAGFAEQEQTQADFARQLERAERISVVHMRPNYMVNRPARLVSGARRRRSSRPL
jgi:hypothetical protein